MALDENDKAEIAKLIAVEVDRLRTDIAAGGKLSVRRAGLAAPTGNYQVPRQPMENDQCCNGCD